MVQRHAGDSATMRLSFSQCSQGGSQGCPAPTPGLSKGLSRLGLSSQQAPASQRQQVPLFDSSNVMDASGCSQLSQALWCASCSALHKVCNMLHECCVACQASCQAVDLRTGVCSTPDVDFITPAEQQSTQGNGGVCALTPAVLSPVRGKRPRNCTAAGRTASQMASLSQFAPGEKSCWSGHAAHLGIMCRRQRCPDGERCQRAVRGPAASR